MRATANSVVSLRFMMKNDQGEVLEDIMDRQPVDYLHTSLLFSFLVPENKIAAALVSSSQIQ